MAESTEELKRKVLQWKECMEVKGLKMNIGKTKVMVLVMLKDWESGHVLYVERVLETILSNV